jgi:hypothetical protein
LCIIIYTINLIILIINLIIIILLISIFYLYYYYYYYNNIFLVLTITVIVHDVGMAFGATGAPGVAQILGHDAIQFLCAFTFRNTHTHT